MFKVLAICINKITLESNNPKNLNMATNRCNIARPTLQGQIEQTV